MLNAKSMVLTAVTGLSLLLLIKNVKKQKEQESEYALGLLIICGLIACVSDLQERR